MQARPGHTGPGGVPRRPDPEWKSRRRPAAVSLVDFRAGTICDVKNSKGEYNTEPGLDNCPNFDGEMNGDFYRVVQVAGAPECPYLEYVDPANCPDVSYDTMLRCEDKCLCAAAWN